MAAFIFLILLVLAAYTSNQIAVEAQDTQIHTVELLVVVDKRAFDTWYKKTPGTNPEERKQATILRITDFLSSLVKGINNLYDSISKHGLLLDVRLKKIHILTHDLWGSNEVRQGFPDQIPTNQAIDIFYNWSWKARDTLGTFDHALLVTGYNVIDPRNPERLTQGVAYKGVMCKYGSVSVVENTFTYQMVDTTAHEIGHSLGSNHDGENNYCDNRLGQVMSSRTEINSTLRWNFSPCSVEAMKRNIAQLNGINANCLVKTITKPTPGVELGTLLSADQQCRMLMGPEAFFCRDFYSSSQDYSKLCSSMWCSASYRDPQCKNHIASDGFVCGHNKVCRRGGCISAETPFNTPVSDICPQGEQPGIVFQNLTCVEAIQKQPWLCYSGFFQRKCCITCPSIQENARGCEFGDKEGWCSTDMKYPYDCYLNEETCCKSCRQYKQPDKPDCRYGDQNIECSTKLSVPLGCYENEALCCGTCAKVKSLTNPNCAFGDKSTWCKEKLEVPSGCYANEELCCQTCAQLANVTRASRKRETKIDASSPLQPRNASSDWCVYGDRYPDWCKKETPYRCYNSTALEWCCQSCANHQIPDLKGCEYGDRYRNCEDLVYPYACYLPVNAEACCSTCGQYFNVSRPSCEYGDRQAWCYSMNDKYSKDQWCHLDKDDGHCCGTCQYNETAIPVFGKKIRTSGIPVPK